ncbi:hypothetical protein, partial [Streptomyces sp. NPDC096153]|uniref:hypothetical protein n=1 Tax=Streptomyces sp. NPDC096153 TaxID=3155548 RepID=UPI003324458A
MRTGHLRSAVIGDAVAGARRPAAGPAAGGVAMPLARGRSTAGGAGRPRAGGRTAGVAAAVA